MQTRLPHRPRKALGALWIGAMIATLAFSASLGSGVAHAEGEEPPPITTEEPSETPEPEVQCTPATDSAGEIPDGSQSISGTVTSGGSPVEGLTVYIGMFGIGTSGATTTNPLGEYQFLGLGSGSYTVAFVDGPGGTISGFWDGQFSPELDPAAATPIELTGTGQTGIDADLQVDPLWTVSGTLTDYQGNPVSNARIEARGLYFGLTACADASSGAFSMLNVDSGMYRLEVQGSGVPSGYYADGAPGNFTTDFGQATMVRVDADLSNIDIAFPQLYSLTGYILDADDAGVPGFYISASDPDTGASGFSGSDETGLFSIDGLPEGDYVLSYSDGNGVHRSGWYAGNGASGAVTEAGALPVAVPQVLPVEILAEVAPTISGRITDPDGAGIAFASLGFCDLSQEQCFGAGADEDGNYTAAVVAPATYYVNVNPSDSTLHTGGYIAALGQPVDRDFDHALGIPAGVADVTGINAELPFGGRIEVRLTSGGSHLDYPYVQFCLAPDQCPEVTWGYDAETDAQSPALFTGSTWYVFYDEDSDGIGVWLVDGGTASSDFADATPLTVTALAFTTITSDVPASGTSTPEGDPVIVIDDGTGTSIQMAFVGVDSGGTTSVSTGDSGPPPPSGFQLGAPATYWDFTTTATGFESVTICIPYGGVSWIAEANLRLFHFDADTDAWEDITNLGYPDLINHVICGTSDSLSPFVLAEPLMSFSGFFQPVDNGVLNKVKAGAGVPVKFSLGGNFGLDIFADGSPIVTAVSCTSSVVDAIEQTVAVGTSHLVYDAATSQYVYLFKTSKSWAGSCQELSMTFTDGSTYSARFQFTK